MQAMKMLNYMVVFATSRCFVKILFLSLVKTKTVGNKIKAEPIILSIAKIMITEVCMCKPTSHLSPFFMRCFFKKNISLFIFPAIGNRRLGGVEGKAE